MTRRDKIIASLRDHRLLVILLVAFLALGVTYSIITPIFEAGDELWHYPFVQHLATGHGLPIQDPNVETLWEQEGGQPPLYYALSALATFGIDTRDLPDRLWHNPHAKIGIPLAFGNKNMVVHTSAESFPWQNTTLAVHVIRFLSLLFSTVTVALTYFLALETLAPHEAVRIMHSHAGVKSDKTLAAVAAAFVAFNPMFLFISASVNNDNLATMLATLALLLLARLVTRGATIRRFVVLGIVLGLGALSKISNLGLLVVAGFVFLMSLRGAVFATKQSPSSQEIASRKTLAMTIVIGSLLCAAIVVVVASWWYVRNWLLYRGDPFAFNVWIAIAGGRPQPVTLVSLLDEFQGFRISFWGNFGGVNLIAPEWVYVLLDTFTVLAAIGLFIGLVRRVLPRLLWLPTLWLVLISVSLVRWTWFTMASQGRLIFPAISVVAMLLASGLAQFQISDFRFQITRYVLRFTHLSFVILIPFAVLAPFTIIAPAYALPPRFPNDAAVPNPVHITFDNQAELVGYDLPQKTIAPGSELPLTIYWRAREHIGEDFSVYIRLKDANGKIIGRWDAFPGGGLYPTRVWQPGEVIEDKYRVPVALDARGPGVGQIEVGLFRRVPLETLTARDPQGNTATPTIARFKIAGQAQAQVENPVDYAFGGKIALVGYRGQEVVTPGSMLQLKLYWRALAAMNEDYTVFVHLVDANGKIIAQRDDQPRSGAYPTSFWDVGEIIADEYALAVPRDEPPGDYRIEVGVYRVEDGTRLPVPGDDHIVLATVRVTR